MRLPVLATLGLAVVASSQIVSVKQADAFPGATRFCAQYKGGAENCGFYTFNQCLASLAGNGGVCVQAAYQGDVIRVHTPYGQYRIRN